MEHAEKVLTGADQEDWVLEKVRPGGGNDLGSESLFGLVFLGKSENRKPSIPELFSHEDHGTFRQIVPETSPLRKMK